MIKPGAVSSKDPKFIWVKMLDCPNGFEQVLAARDIFNNVLHDLVASSENHFLLDVTRSMIFPENFTLRNEVNYDGKIRFWTELDSILQQFDFNKISLKPAHHSGQKSLQCGVQSTHRRRSAHQVSPQNTHRHTSNNMHGRIHHRNDRDQHRNDRQDHDAPPSFYKPNRRY